MTTTQSQESLLEEWLADRPEPIRVAARAYPPWLLYRMQLPFQFVAYEGKPGAWTVTNYTRAL